MNKLTKEELINQLQAIKKENKKLKFYYDASKYILFDRDYNDSSDEAYHKLEGMESLIKKGYYSLGHEYDDRLGEIVKFNEEETTDDECSCEHTKMCGECGTLLCNSCGLFCIEHNEYADN